MPSQLTLILRLLLVAGLAGALGVERELTEQPAGFRTHILVGLGAALFAEISAYGFQSIAGLGPSGEVRADVTRIASQIVVGIGFLGGGAILKYGASVRGLTTAANLWITAAVGTAVGIGALELGAAATGIALIALVGLRPLRSMVRRYGAGHEVLILQMDRAVDLERVIATVNASGGTLRELRIADEGEHRTVHLATRLPRGTAAADLATGLSRIGGVHAVDWGG